MQDFYQNRKGRNLRKYCNDEGIDYKWLSEYKRTYGATKTAASPKANTTDYGFTVLDVIEERLSPEQQQPSKDTGWTVKQIIICSPEGEELEIRSEYVSLCKEYHPEWNSFKYIYLPS